jgi:uncharacterized surface protein with fasciclin (FAS1) repeats
MKILNYVFAFGLFLSFLACGGGESKSDQSEESSMEELIQEESSDVEEIVEDESPKDIVALAMETESLSTLVSAVKAAGLVETLQGEGPFTVFAPTNEAFAALPEGTLDDLLKPENKEKLASILTYHVVAGKVMSTDLSDGMKAKTVNGAEVSISTVGGAKVNGANVVSADVAASNGVVHVIDAVIMPPKK